MLNTVCLVLGLYRNRYVVYLSRGGGGWGAGPFVKAFPSRPRNGDEVMFVCCGVAVLSDHPYWLCSCSIRGMYVCRYQTDTCCSDQLGGTASVLAGYLPRTSYIEYPFQPGKEERHMLVLFKHNPERSEGIQPPCACAVTRHCCLWL